MRILIIEDDQDLCRLICLALNQAGYETDSCHTGSDGLFYAKNQAYDAIILATALGSLPDRVSGLDAGADDYLVKPFAMEELTARIRALTRRPGSLSLSPTLTAFGLTLDPASRQLNYKETSLNLSKKEGALMEYFMKNPSQTLPRAMILSYVWGSSCDVEEGNLDNYVYFLRRRLKALDAPVKLSTVHGVGYRLEAKTK